MVKFVVTLYVLECFDSFWNCLVSNICDLISAANGCRMVSMNSLCHQVAERLQLVIAPASLGDCNELTPADGNPKHVKIPSAIHSYLWHLGRCQLGTCPDQIPTLKKSVCLSIAWFHPLHEHVCCEWHSTSRIPSNSSTVESPSCDLTFRLQHIRSSANVTSEMQHCHCTIISYIWYQFLLKHASFHCSSELSVWLWIWLNMHMGLY